MVDKEAVTQVVSRDTAEGEKTDQFWRELATG